MLACIGVGPNKPAEGDLPRDGTAILDLVLFLLLLRDKSEPLPFWPKKPGDKLPEELESEPDMLSLSAVDEGV